MKFHAGFAAPQLQEDRVESSRPYELSDEAQNILEQLPPVWRDCLLEEIKKVNTKKRMYLRDMIFARTGGRLRLCEDESEQPAPLPLYPDGRVLPIPLHASSLSDLRRRVRAAAQEAGLSVPRSMDLSAAASEAGMNCVLYANQAIAEVRSDAERGIVQVWISDSGNGIDEQCLHRVIEEQGFTVARTQAQGLWIMVRTCEAVYLLTGPGGTTIVLEMGRTPREEAMNRPPAWFEEERGTLRLTQSGGDVVFSRKS